MSKKLFCKFFQLETFCFDIQTYILFFITSSGGRRENRFITITKVAMKIETIMTYVLLKAEKGFAFFTFLSSVIMNTSLYGRKSSYITSYIDQICVDHLYNTGVLWKRVTPCESITIEYQITSETPLNDYFSNGERSA